jgi:hypothetical protein
MCQFVRFAVIHFPQFLEWWHFHAATFATEFAWSHCFRLGRGADALCAAKSCHLGMFHHGRPRVVTAMQREVLMRSHSSNATTASVCRIVGAFVLDLTSFPVGSTDTEVLIRREILLDVDTKERIKCSGLQAVKAKNCGKITLRGVEL